MRHHFIGATLFLSCAIAIVAAEREFSKTLSSDDFMAAGLAKLTPAEIARLDALVRGHQGGAGVAPQERATAAGEEREAEKRGAEAGLAAAAEKAAKPEGGLLARAKVRLAAGTEVEYETVESRIVGEFRGWESRTVFTLENGQRWQVDGTQPYVMPPVHGPAVRITPGLMGSYWMTIEGVRTRAKVRLIDAR
jgi:hypothetical protein